jgi:intraflagellar transport protein 140
LAFELCLSYDFPLTEEIADQLCGSSTDPVLLMKIADLCLAQKSYHLACKKYTQAGDRIKALKALLQSNDSEKIIFFATISGKVQREIYVIAANYLQTLDWRSSPELLQAIVTFYTKVIMLLMSG